MNCPSPLAETLEEGVRQKPGKGRRCGLISGYGAPGGVPGNYCWQVREIIDQVIGFVWVARPRTVAERHEGDANSRCVSRLHVDR